MRLDWLRRLFRHEATGGAVLMLASALALVLANSPLDASYDLLSSVRGSVRIGSFGIEKPLLLWINDGLMAIFFMLVGLEIKRELIEGELSDRSRAPLPASAALGGMAVPALLYLAITRNAPGAAVGWAIPSATRHRLLARRHRALWQPRPGFAQAFPDGTCDHRRSRVDRHHRDLLYRAAFLGLSRRGSGGGGGPRRLEPRRSAARDLVRARRPRIVGVRAQIGRPRHPGRRGARPRHPVQSKAWRSLSAHSHRTR